MDKQPVFFCVCSQKGGVGKSTFTILLASWLHYALGRDVLVVDCDAPQWSIVAQRERELDVLERNDRYKLMMVRLFKRTGRKIWPVVRSTPEEGLQAAHAYLAAGDREADCGALMEPIGMWVRKNGEWALLHRCRMCGTIHANRVAADDNPLLLMSLASKPLACPPFPLDKLEELAALSGVSMEG